MKKQTHLTDEQLIDIYFGHSSNESERLNVHLNECSDCRNQYDELISVLETAAQIPTPVLPPAERVEQFERAWEESGRIKQLKVVHWNEMWRYAFSFGLGLFLGMACILFFMQETIADIQHEYTAKVQQEIPQQLRGKHLETVYSSLENPVIIVERESNQQKSDKRVLYGTIDEGKVQVIWNL